MANGHLGAERKNVPVPITVPPKPDATKFTEGKLAHLNSRGPLLTGFRQKLMRVILGDFRSILSSQVLWNKISLFVLILSSSRQ